MMHWREYRKKIVERVGDFRNSAPKVVEGYAALASSGDKAVHLDGKTRELIALAVAVTTRCDGCIASHVEAALKYGVARAEIAEALGVAIALNAGAAFVYSARVLDCYAEMATASSGAGHPT
jgi:AhpD family alkylhydroperoxidase